MRQKGSLAPVWDDFYALNKLSSNITNMSGGDSANATKLCED